MSNKLQRDIEKDYNNAEFVANLCWLAVSHETGKNFEIQIADERNFVPVLAEFNT